MTDEDNAQISSFCDSANVLLVDPEIDVFPRDDILVSSPSSLNQNEDNEEFELMNIKRPKSRPSWYEEFFQPVIDHSMRKHKCLLCGWIGMALPNSLHNLKRHFSSVVKHKGCKEKFSAWTKDRELVQPTLESVVTGEVRKLSSETQGKFDKLLAEFIVASEVPLHLVEIPEFRAFCNALDFKYQLPYRPKLKNSLLFPMLEDSNIELTQKLNKCIYVSLTIDGWSSRRLLSMLSLVVNFVDVDGTLRSELLTISYFKGRHTAERIAEFVIQTAKQWKIEDKIIRIGSDNAQT